MPKKFTTFKNPALQTPRSVYDRAYDERRMQDPRLAEAARIRGSREWKLTRDRKKKQNPICELRGAGCKIMADDAHHIIQLVDEPRLGLTPANLRSLCTVCHRVPSLLENAGRNEEAVRLFLTKEEEQALRDSVTAKPPFIGIDLATTSDVGVTQLPSHCDSLTHKVSTL